jgi:anthranilate phosphoribosyltransferase
MMEPEAELEQESNYPCLDVALAAKGIGPKGLKPLSKEVMLGAVEELQKGAPQELMAAFLMGFQVLEKNEAEIQNLQMVFKPSLSKLSPSLTFLLKPLERQHAEGAEAWIQTLIRGEELDAKNCALVIEYLLQPEAEPSYKVALLQGLRVKRETDNENEALLRALYSKAPRCSVEIEHLVDLSLPYDGMTRNEDISLELAALLALMGQACVIHSVRGLGPKYGSVILDKIDSRVDCGLLKAQQGLAECGVGILDQSSVFPELHALLELRNNMRKRPFLATMEKMLQPVRAKKNTLVTGYVHSAYRESIPEMLTRVGHFENILLVKGLEGSVVLDPTKKQSAYYYSGSTKSEQLLPRWEALKSSDNALNLWWRNLSNPLTQRLLLTAGTILNFVIGDRTCDDIIALMQKKLDDGLLEEQLVRIGSVYPFLRV